MFEVLEKPVNFAVKNPIVQFVLANLFVFFFVGMALCSTSEACMMYEDDMKCSSMEAAKIKLSGNIILLIVAAVAVLAMLAGFMFGGKASRGRFEFGW